ncbi:MAG: sigma-70 family RNA polymerase sigma factor [Planctomycetes bacterium]|nr:sigma-70 family RNA polymerase sigma factor [Planctomycetota bacterium]
MRKPDHPKNLDDEEILGGILVDAIDRLRRGECPAAEEYALKHPRLRGEIEERLRILQILEAGGGGKSATGGADLAAAIATFSPGLQRLFYLRHFESRPWPEIARLLAEPEETLRRQHARALKELMLKCAPA